jgi:hypothetical protein
VLWETAFLLSSFLLHDKELGLGLGLLHDKEHSPVLLLPTNGGSATAASAAGAKRTMPTMLELGAGYGARFRQKMTLEDAIGSHACSLEANMRVTNGIPLGCFTPLTGSHCKFRPNTEGVGWLGWRLDKIPANHKLRHTPLNGLKVWVGWVGGSTGRLHGIHN